MNIYLEHGAFPPLRAHPTDAGLDIRALHDGLVRAHQSALFHTDVHVEQPRNTAGLCVSKSGLMIDHDITSSGLIDEGYDGEVMVKLFNHGDEDYHVRAGDKITQLVVIPTMYEPVEIVDHISGGERGGHGFGSTGR